MKGKLPHYILFLIDLDSKAIKYLDSMRCSIDLHLNDACYNYRRYWCRGRKLEKIFFVVDIVGSLFVDIVEFILFCKI